MATNLFFSLLLLSLTPTFTCSTSYNSITKGSSLRVEDPDQVLVSPSKNFIAGFYPVGQNAYCFAVWFNEPSCSNTANCTVVWTANRNEPVNGKRSKLSLLKNGDLVLTDAGKSVVWSTHTVSGSLSKLHLQDSGNLVLEDTRESVTLWQSFDSPTDTLLPDQPFMRDAKLISSRSQTNISSGFYQFYFDNDNVLRLLYDGPEISSVFWPDPGSVPWEVGRSTYNSSRIALLDSSGNFTATDNFTFLSADFGAKIQRRLTLDFDGNLRLYSRDDGRGPWQVSWQVISQPCSIHGICGPNSVCSHDSVSGRRCSCIPGFRRVNLTDWSFGCENVFKLSCDVSESTFTELPHVEFYGYDFGYYPNTTLDKCKEICLQTCDCKGFQLKFEKLNHPSDIPYCFAKTLLLNGRFSPNFHGNLYLKVPKSSGLSNHMAVNDFSLGCPSKMVVEQLDRKYIRNHGNWTVKFLLWFVIGVGLLEILGMTLVWIFLFRTQQNRGRGTQGYHVAATGFKRFTYAELKKATKNFGEEIGRGAGGIVYKGRLSDNRVAAIKQLNEANQGEAEFLAEVGTIGKLNHMYLIEMWGYCAEGRKRLLVYEYMEHGSLAENLSSKALDWKKRFEIAMGTAKGLAYLHEECLEWVLHCDVKPQNILLDSKYQPKVSDFGLSRLLSRSELQNSGFSRIRGTRGYMAPEWVFNLPITSKVDVYSYGIVLLEMVTGKSPGIGVRDVENDEDVVEHQRLVEWIREKKSGGGRGSKSWVKEIVDPVFGDELCDMDKLETLVGVALQCVEEDKDARPTMSQVIEMLLRDDDDDDKDDDGDN